LLLTPILCRLGLALLFAFVFSGCDREEIRVYSVPKESPPPTEKAVSVPVPPDWKQVEPGQMLRSKYVIAGQGGRAEVSVSAFPGATGGLLANVNRWRGQLQLQPISEDKLAELTSNLDVGGGKATLVDMTGQDPKAGQKARIIGSIVPKESETWFYKLMGDEQVVERQKDTFKAFVQSAARAND
jgi:hypothetical protein